MKTRKVLAVIGSVLAIPIFGIPFAAAAPAPLLSYDLSSGAVSYVLKGGSGDARLNHRCNFADGSLAAVSFGAVLNWHKQRIVFDFPTAGVSCAADLYLSGSLAAHVEYQP